MGQPIEITSSRPGSRPEVMIFSINRALTGMRIEEYPHPAHATGDRWTDEMARRLGELGVERVTIYANSIVAEAPDWSGLVGEVEDAIRKLYVFYVDGKLPEDPVAGDTDEGDSGEGGSGEGGSEESGSGEAA